jgi:transposase
VVAPGKIPRPANRGSKTDRLDCRELAERAEKGDLKAVEIPTEEQEGDRQVVRLRGQLVNKLRRVKQQIKGFLLYYGLQEPAGLAHWNAEGIAALGELELLAQLRFALDILVEELKSLKEILKRVEKRLMEIGAQACHREEQERLQTHPGVGWRTAMTFRAEVFQPERFGRTEQLSRYVGLAPRVRQSGQTRHGGPLIRAGCGQLRAMLVEASWRWVRDDPGARRVFRRIMRNTGSSKKAIVAMARRMAVNLWLMMRRRETYRFAV